MRKEQKIAGVGKVEIIDNKVVKRINQTVSGSAYMKMAGQVIAIHQAGYDNIELQVNRSNPYISRIETQVSLLKQVIPNITVKTVDS